MSKNNRIFYDTIKDIENSKPINNIATKLNIQRSHAVLAGFIITLFLVLTGILTELIIAIFGFMYPAYMSHKALEYDEQTNKQTAKWITYWIVFSTLLFIDNAFGWLLQFIPFYYLFKLILIMWLFYPKSDGAGLIYNKIIYPYLKQNESKVDEALEKIKNVDISSVLGGEDNC